MNSARRMHARGSRSNPLGDLARLLAQLRRHALGGSVYDGSGHRHPATLDELGVLGILQAGDLNPALRALLPAAVQSALRHDPDPLLRLHLLSEGLIPTVPRGREEHPVGENNESIDEALFVTTSCEETPFPWQRSAAPATKLSEALSRRARPAEIGLLSLRCDDRAAQQPDPRLLCLARRVAGAAAAGAAARTCPR